MGGCLYGPVSGDPLYRVPYMGAWAPSIMGLMLQRDIACTGISGCQGSTCFLLSLIQGAFLGHSVEFSPMRFSGVPGMIHPNFLHCMQHPLKRLVGASLCGTLYAQGTLYMGTVAHGHHVALVPWYVLYIQGTCMVCLLFMYIKCPLCRVSISCMLYTCMVHAPYMYGIYRIHVCYMYGMYVLFIY